MDHEGVQQLVQGVQTINKNTIYCKCGVDIRARNEHSAKFSHYGEGPHQGLFPFESTYYYFYTYTDIMLNRNLRMGPVREVDS